MCCDSGATLELAEALGRRGRSSPRQGPRPGRRGAAAGGDHASDVDRRHAIPVEQGCCRRGSTGVGKRSNRKSDHGIRFGGCVRQDVGPDDIDQHSVAAASLGGQHELLRD